MSKNNKEDKKPDKKPEVQFSRENQPAKPATEFGLRSTQLRVQITEDSKGNLNVEWVSKMTDSDVAIPMRPSHVIGQLTAAAYILERKFYRDELQSSGSASSA